MSKVKPDLLQILSRIGSFIGGIAALGAALLLTCNLCAVREQIDEMERQTELEYKGYVFMEIDTVRIPPSSNKFTVWSYYKAVSKVPLFFLYIFKLNRFSDEREIDFNEWIREVGKEIDTMRLGWQPLKENNLRKDEYENIAPLVRMDSIFLSLPENQILGSSHSFFYHVIYKFKDWLGDEYWAYSCWEIMRICKGIKGDMIIFEYKYIDTDFEVWRAKQEEMLPDTLNLPVKYKIITQQVQESNI